MDLKKYIRSIPDYPKKGILFRDITTLIKDENAFKSCIDKIVKISMVGVGMRTHAGIASKMFSVLAENNINISMISTSEIKISIVIDENNLDTAVNVLEKRRVYMNLKRYC